MDDWQNSTRDISRKVQYILSSQCFSDAEFIIGNEKINCHKLILAMGSPVFQAMFFGRNAEPQGPIVIEDIKPHAFQQIIESIYGKTIIISSCKNACDLYYAAKKYFLHFLKDDCIEYLKSNITSGNVLNLYEFAKFHNEEKLEKQCIMEIQLNTEEVFEEKHLCDISEETLESILDLNLMNVSSELCLFNVVEKWVDINKKDISLELKQKICFILLKKVRLLTLTVKEFAEGPAKSKYLSDAEKLAILLRITKAEESPMNNGLCEFSQKRKQPNFKCMSILNITDVSHARCDGSEWLTSVFKTNSPINLLGLEIRLQVNEEEGEYFENIMVKLGEANSDEHFAEGSLCGAVKYNGTAQIMFNVAAPIQPCKEYALHVFLCRAGMYPIGKHANLLCHNETVIIDFVSHSSWERAHPFHTTVISSLIYTES